MNTLEDCTGHLSTEKIISGLIPAESYDWLQSPRVKTAQARATPKRRGDQHRVAERGTTHTNAEFNHFLFRKINKNNTKHFVQRKQNHHETITSLNLIYIYLL